ncbi:MAG TPA: hypothetical protein PLJ21_03740 [Pseudobdellovibrionaceae bacterium]|nr:hypothetical protein [Pseudobdellovibrionaceae bacterium]
MGTERSFIAAGLTTKSTHLIVADIDPKAILYVYINTVLLKAAEDRQQYIKLRQAKSIDELYRLSSSVFQYDNIKLLHKTWTWWSSIQAQPGIQAMYEMNLNNPESKFLDANYLLYENQFQIVHELAKKDKIHAFLVDLGNLQTVAKLKQWLDLNNINPAAIDVSNAWSYMKSEKLLESLRLIGKSSLPGSVLIATTLPDRENDFTGFNAKDDWLYTSLRMQDYFLNPWIFERLVRPISRYNHQRMPPSSY